MNGKCGEGGRQQAQARVHAQVPYLYARVKTVCARTRASINTNGSARAQASAPAVAMPERERACVRTRAIDFGQARA
ncbi:unnamed protein product [Mesocestoides corti]|uniref:Uncharacterized protein n=1 Tax=Mesocestoides corti TaxID=53468 RepID=A0A0R3U3P5_MESCO|nr:unnamed protein product [Mesocestoides corti]